MEPMNARSKAAAWAWYQRGAGSALLATSQPEVTSPRRSGVTRAGSSPSRFKLEADLLLSCASIDDTSARLKSLHLLSDSCDSSSCGSDIVCVSTGALDPPSMPQLNTGASNQLTQTADFAIVMSSSSYGTASWDCGSALFDSFELISMSKTLDDAHQLNEAAMEKVCPPAEDVPVRVCDGTGTHEEEEEEEKHETKTGFQPLKTTPMGTKVSCGLGTDTGTNSASNDCTQSRQAIYDMFCGYENLVTPVKLASNAGLVKKSQSSSSISPSARSTKQYRRHRLHSLSKAFRHLTRQSQMRSSTPIHHQLSNELYLQESAALQSKSSPHLWVHHHKATCGLESSGWGGQSKAELGSNLRKQHPSNGMHHYHHHHYHHHHHHYRLQHHPNDSLGLLPVTPLLAGADKSLQVAAAGLRRSKVNSLLSSRLEGASLDAKHEWGDIKSHVAANFTIDSCASPISQEIR